MKTSLLPAIVLILIGLSSSISQASPQQNSLKSFPYIQLAQSGQSLQSATESIKQQTAGRILSAETVSKNGQRIHKIKVLLPSGKVRVFKVKAQ